MLRRRPHLLAALAGALLGALAAPACSSKTPVDPHTLTAQELYLHVRCDQCHGRGGEGGFMAPPLRGIAEHWDRESLIEYLKDPRPVIERTPRLQQMKRRYSMEMRSFRELDEELRGRLADWLLARP